MDPRNFLNEVRLFQFEGLTYDGKTNYVEGIEKILYGTEFYQTIVKYVDASGKEYTMTSRYADLILEAGKTSQVNSYHLASRIKQEVGPFLTHSSISGKVPGFEGLYNFYNIGATSSAEPMGAIKNGLQYAKVGKGASQQTKDKYLIPWNNKQKSITGGGIFIGSSYIHLGQDTIYLQKFHVTNKDSGGSLFWHQYMTNVLAPYSESRSIYQGYSNSGLLNTSMSFVIPVYENMPEIPMQNPNILESDFTKDNTKVYADVNNTLNIRTGPSTSYEVITSVNRNETMTRLAKGKQSGELWDQVQLENGIIGYAFQSYLKEKPEVQIEQIHLHIENSIIEKGKTGKLEVEILPEEASTQEVEYSSSNTKVATVDAQGNILAIRSGETIITVKAKGSNVSSQMKIQVYSKVTDILLNITELVLQEGDSFLLETTVLPEDANNPTITYQVIDQNIVAIDGTGEIIALKEGNTKITVTAKDTGIQKTVLVTVVPKITPDEITFDPSLTITGNIITGWDIEHTKVKEVKEKIKTDYEIEVYEKNGQLLEEDQLIGTGSKIRIVEEGQIRMEYQIVIYGDVNGDGKINSVDLLVLQRHILEIDKLRGVFVKAGNIQKNGKNPSSLDSLLIQRHILQLQSIQQ